MARQFELPAGEFCKLPFFTGNPAQRRVVALHSYYDDAERDWHMYIQTPDGKGLMRLQGGEVHEGVYLARSPQQPERDVEIVLGTLVTRYLAFSGAQSAVSELATDFSNLSAVLAKYEMISDTRHDSDKGASILVASEMEYLLVLVRSIYDLIHETLRSVPSALLRTPDDAKRKKPRALPKSFADIVFVGQEKFRTAEEMNERWGLPQNLAAYYEAEGDFFRFVRTLRDLVVHSRKPEARMFWAFTLPEGLAIQTDQLPWKDLSIWNPDQLRPNGLGSLRAVFAYLVRESIAASERFAAALEANVSLPPPLLTPGVRLYARGRFIEKLHGLGEVLTNPWEGSPAR